MDDGERTTSRRAVLRSGVAGLSGVGVLAGSASADPEGTGSDLHPDNCTPKGLARLYLTGSCIEADGDRYKTYPDHDAYEGAWREWQSPLRNEHVPAGYHRPFSAVETARATADTQALGQMDLPEAMDVSLINVKRDADGTPYYRYFTTDERPQEFETWDGSQFMAAAAAAAKIRHASDGDVGLDSTLETGRHVGELVTYLHNDQRGGNMHPYALGGYFLTVAGTDWATDLLREWVGSSKSSFRGGYDRRPSALPYTFRSDGGVVYVNSGRGRTGDKRMTTLAMAEFLKRLVMHREDPATRVPGFRAEADHDAFWNDLQILFYGEPGNPWGGMQDERAIYLETTADLDSLADGQWRIFSKAGYGLSSKRRQEEFIYVGYACFPTAEDPTDGSEFVIALQYSLPDPVDSDAMDREVRSAVGTVAHYVRTGQLEAVASAPSQTPCRDITNHWAESKLRTLLDAGVLSGYPDGTVRPDTTITRAEFATLIANAFDPDPDSRRDFEDVQGHWAAEKIRQVAGAGFFSGYEDGRFRPAQSVRKDEALVALVSGLDVPEGDPATLDSRYTDAHKVPEWARAAVAGAVEAGWVENDPLEAWLEPRAAATRAELATYVYAAMQ